MKRHPQSILVTGLPLERGSPMHFEHDDDTAVTAFDHAAGGIVREIHTPQDPLRRIHELMHARHTPHDKAGVAIYRGIIDPVRQVTEDCRIHLLHWPWRPRRTPASIAGDARKFVAWECREVMKAAAAAKGKADAAEWPVFATHLRAACVLQGIDGSLSGELSRKFKASGPKQLLARQACDLLLAHKTRKAAILLQNAFFDPPEDSEKEKGEKTDTDGDDGEGNDDSGIYTKDCKMQVIELPHTEAIQEASIGTRIATSGSRIFRPALRRPVLPSRMFVRRSIMEPAGTILIDASGSMGRFSFVEEQCRAAPFATVAYYAGNGRDAGWLYVYARGGMRARELIEPDSRDNTIDGLALDWLLKQDAPRIFVTDLAFCDVADSTAQAVRLERLERQGLLTVREYRD